MKKRKRLKVLIACECSQTVCKEFRLLGDLCFSCDIEDEYGGKPEWHIKQDVTPLLTVPCKFKTQDGKLHFIKNWDLIIAHPPCTYLSGAQYGLYNRKRFSEEYVSNRERQRELAIKFFLRFTKTNCPTLIENPVGYMNSHYKKPTQTIQPYQFGDPYTKRTCLWLYDLPKLKPTNVVTPLPPVKTKTYSMGIWMFNTSKLSQKDRPKARSKTFPGIAKAIATQYHSYLIAKKD